MLIFEFNKSLLKQIVSVSFLSFIISACTLPKSEKKSDSANSNNSAQFYIDKTIPQILEEKLSKVISVPNEHVVNLAVCLKDIKYRKEIPNENFKVTDAENSIEKELKSDSKGCLVWTESFQFSFFGTGRPVQIDRLIIGNGSLVGKQKISLQYNPWEKTIIALKEQSPNDPITTKTSVSALMETPELKSMILDNMRLTIEEKSPDSTAANLNMEIRASAQVPVTKSNKAKIYEALSFGEFNTTIYLIHVYFEDGKELRQLLGNPIKKSSKIANQVLLIDTDFKLPILRSRSQFYVGLKVEPKNSIPGLKPFEGVFNVGEFDQIKGNFLARIKNISLENENFNLEQFINVKSVLDPNQSIQNGSYINAAFQVDELEFSNFEQKNINAFQRNKVFTTKACIHSNIDRKTAKGQIFIIKTLNGQTIESKANQLGCFEFVDSISYDFLAQECKKEFTINISNSNLGINENILIQANPWAEHSSIKDVRFLKNKNELVRCTTDDGEIQIENFNYRKNKYSYFIDSNLSFYASRKININVRLRLKKPSLSDDEGYITPDLPKGPYVFKYAIVDNDFDFTNFKGQVYYSNEVVMPINGNNYIAEQINLQSPDLKSIGNSNQIAIQIYPIDPSYYKTKLIKEIPNLKLKKQLFIGTLDLEMQKDSLVLRPISVTGLDNKYFNKLKNMAQTAFEQKSKDLSFAKNKNNFANKENLNLINLNELNTQSKSKNDLSYILHFLKIPNYDPSAAAWFADSKVGQYLFGKNKDSNSAESEITSDKNNFNTKYFNESYFIELFNQDKLNKLPKSSTCKMFFNFLKPSVNSLPESKEKQLAYNELENFLDYCISNSSSENSNFIDVHYRILTDHVKSYQILDSRVGDFTNSFAFNQKHDFSFNEANSLSTDVGASFSPMSLITDSKLFSVSAGIRYAYSRTKSFSSGYGSNINLQSGTSGYIEQIPVKITADSYEKCAVIRIHAKYLSDWKRWDVLHTNPELPMPNLINTPISTQNKSSVLSRGFLICDGYQRKQEINFIENYFVVNQKRQPETQVVDMGEAKNRHFFAALRGRSDFAKFLSFVGGRTSLLNGITNENFSKYQSNLNSSGWTDYSTVSYPGHFLYSK